MKNRLLKFILEQAEMQPVARRVTIYRDLSLSVTGALREEFLALAEKLDAINAKSSQLLLDLQQLTTDQP